VWQEWPCFSAFVVGRERTIEPLTPLEVPSDARSHPHPRHRRPGALGQATRRPGPWVAAAIFGRILPLHDLLNGIWLGHPLHGVLTDVPIGALTLVIVFDLLGQRVVADVALRSPAAQIVIGGPGRWTGRPRSADDFRGRSRRVR
jgi:hypothetical protein